MSEIHHKQDNNVNIKKINKNKDLIKIILSK